MGAGTLQVWVDETRRAGGVRRKARLEYRDGRLPVQKRSLWYEIESTGVLPDLLSLNAFACALVFEAMRTQRSLHLHGPVSRSLLERLEEYQAAYARWEPGRLHRVAVTADQELAPPDGRSELPAALAFSGGVDALFSYFRHARRFQIQYPRPIKTAVLVHGFDIRLASEEAFATARNSAEAILKDEPIDRVWVKTNVREDAFIGRRRGGQEERWQRTYGAALASCMHQLEATHCTALFGSDEPYHQLLIPWGSSPITNPLLSSDLVSIVYDAGGYTRTQKVAAIAQWPSAVENLRVCFKSREGVNCGRCDKCLRTALNFLALDLSPPPGLPQEVSTARIREVNLNNPLEMNFYQDIAEQARISGAGGAWLDAVHETIARAERGRRKSNQTM